ncbi:MAG: hypothetical protein H6Q62_353 [Firmicutes bacterium]|nr:hypothetical protein [Bacillota bacterium]
MTGAVMEARAVDISIWLFFGMVIYYLVYRLLPYISCQLDSRLAAALRPTRAELNYNWHKWIPQQVLAVIKRQLVQAGFRTPRQINLYLLALLLPLPVSLALTIVIGGSPSRAVLCGLLGSILVNGWLSHRTKLRQKAFQMCLYKIYRFLDLQLSAGVKAMDVLKGLADAIDQPLIKPDFQRFCAQLELTLDLDRSLQELETVFAGPDMNLLVSQLRNSLQTGIIGHTFLRMENLMFNRHLALIQARSKQIRTWLLLVGLLALFPIEILFVYPLIAQALQAFGQIFGP